MDSFIQDIRDSFIQDISGIVLLLEIKWRGILRIIRTAGGLNKIKIKI